MSEDAPNGAATSSSIVSIWLTEQVCQRARELVAGSRNETTKTIPSKACGLGFRFGGKVTCPLDIDQMPFSSLDTLLDRYTLSGLGLQAAPALSSDLRFLRTTGKSDL